MIRILLVEDDPLIARSLKMSLAYQGFEVSSRDTLATANSLLERESFDLLIFDVNLPDGSGFDLCKSVRARGDQVPILMLTAKVDEESAVEGMTIGADDYVRKPFGVKELAIRMHKLLDRKVKSKTQTAFGPLRLDLGKRLAWAGEVELSLGKREFDILSLLVQKQGEVVRREEILSSMGDTTSEIFDRTIDSHLSHLRRKIRETSVTGVQITPVYGVGYRLEQKEAK